MFACWHVYNLFIFVCHVHVSWMFVYLHVYTLLTCVYTPVIELRCFASRAEQDFKQRTLSGCTAPHE